MRTVLFVAGFLMGIGGLLVLLATVVSGVASGVAWVNSMVASQRAKAKEHQRTEQPFADRRRRVAPDRLAA